MASHAVPPTSVSHMHRYSLDVGPHPMPLAWTNSPSLFMGLLMSDTPNVFLSYLVFHSQLFP